MTSALLEKKTSSPKLLAGVGVFLALGSISTSASSSSMPSHISVIERINYEEQTNTPEITNIERKTDKYKEVKEIFPVMRDFNVEEITQYNKSLDKLFVPIGKNIFDL